MGKQNDVVATQETTVEAAQAATQETTAPTAVAVAEPVKEGLGTKIINGAKKHKTTIICLAAAAAGVGAFLLGRKFGKKDAEEDEYYRHRFDDEDEDFEDDDEEFDEDFEDDEDDADDDDSETTTE